MMGVTYATWDPAHKNSMTLSGGNLIAADSGAFPKWVQSTVGVSSGKFYCELAINDILVSHRNIWLGVQTGDVTSPNLDPGSWSYRSYNGKKYHDSTQGTYGNYYDDNHIVCIALDMDNGKVWCARDGVWQNGGDPAAGTNEMYSGITGTIYIGFWVPYYSGDAIVQANFGQNAFAYSVPTGFYPGFAYITNDIEIEFPPLGVSAYGGATMDITLPSVETEIYAFTPVVDVFDTYITGKVDPDPIPITHEETRIGKFEATLLPFQMQAYGGGTMDMDLPALIMDMEAYAGNLGIMEMLLPKLRMSMRSGGVMEMTIPAFLLEAEGSVAEVANIAMYLSALSMQATGTTNLVGNIEEILPQLMMYMRGYAGSLADVAIEIPYFEFDMTGYSDISGDLAAELQMPALIIRASQGGRFDNYLLSYDADELGCD